MLMSATHPVAQFLGFELLFAKLLAEVAEELDQKPAVQAAGSCQ